MPLHIEPLVVSTELSAVPNKTWKKEVESFGKDIRDHGYLVVFPTETVYGLGANALDRDAVLRIFEAKGRPLSDPVICHVTSIDEALELYSEEENELVLRVLRILAEDFWPGPLSLVARASTKVIPELTASTGYVSVRCPNNIIALELIKASGVPIAAPSANRFGHISPSCSAHVAKDFSNLVLQGGLNGYSQQKLPILDGGSCSIGIESTVCKVEVKGRSEEPFLQFTVLRRGHVSTEMLNDSLHRHWTSLMSSLSSPADVKALSQYRICLSEKLTELEARVTDASCESTDIVCERESDVPSCSPGTLLTHYAPSLPTFLLSKSNGLAPAAGTHVRIGTAEGRIQDIPLKNCILIDSFDLFKEYTSTVARYFNLSSSDIGGRCETDAAAAVMQHRLFDQLHGAEDAGLYEAARSDATIIICIADFRVTALGLGESALAVYDRLYRSASGRKAHVICKESQAMSHGNPPLYS